MTSNQATEKDEPETLLDTWVELKAVLKESKPEMDRFERNASAFVQTTLEKMHAEIKDRLKKLETETDYDWSPFLDDLDVYNWEPGDFQTAIREWLKREIKSEAGKLK